MSDRVKLKHFLIKRNEMETKYFKFEKIKNFIYK